VSKPIYRTIAPVYLLVTWCGLLLLIGYFWAIFSSLLERIFGRTSPVQDTVLFISYFSASAFILLFAAINEHRIHKRVDARASEAAALAGRQNYDIRLTGAPWSTTYYQSALNSLPKHGFTLSNILSAKDGAWEYAEITYATYRKIRDSEYESGRVYYSVMSVPLPRMLPNVFFDSLHARKRQFRFIFSAKQKHSLEGDFDKFFVTYFPSTYTIDSMSFITPDVMWAMRIAAMYDIEIVGNRLYLYGPLQDFEAGLEDMYNKIMAIRKTLLITTAAYRDDRLPQEVADERVTALGANLQRSQFLKIMAFVATMVFGLIYLILLFMGH